MELYVGKQLFTRDGRKVGNAIVIEQVGDSWKLETDFGNNMTFNANEIAEFYWELDVDDDQLVLNDLNRWRTDRMKNILRKPGFVWIGRDVTVRGEDFTYKAYCLCAFPKRNGKVRYIVEDNGRLFIQREEQIVWMDEPKPTDEEERIKAIYEGVTDANSADKELQIVEGYDPRTKTLKLGEKIREIPIGRGCPQCGHFHPPDGMCI
jgi:hypothetical protein